MATAKEIRALGAAAVAELRSNGSPHGSALADWIEALNATMDVRSDPAPETSEQEFTPPELRPTPHVVNI